jgi:hypothetical protein
MPVVESIADAITATMAMITKSLPSDEERLLRFKLKYPKRYMRVKMQILRQSFRYLKHHRQITPDEFVAYIGGIYSIEEKQILVSMLNKEFSKQNQQK